MTQEHDENSLIAQRRAKLDALRATGNAYPNGFRRDALAADLVATYGARSAEALDAEPIAVRVAGRMVAKRVMGKSSFVGLQDGSGRIQLFLTQEALGAAYEAFKGFDLGDQLAAVGTLMRTRTGELSVKVGELQLLAKALRPLPEKWHGLTDTETRYRQRYLDLIVTPEARETFRRRTLIVSYIRRFMDALGFMEVETPMLQPIAGGAIARPFTTHHNALDIPLFLRIAPELYLKRLVVGGLEKVYEINRNFRNEGVSTRHNPEFTMLEFYWAYHDFHDLMDLTERMLRGLAEEVTGSATVRYQGADFDFGKPFRRVSVEEAVASAGFERARLRDRDYLMAQCERLGLIDDLEHPGVAHLGPGALLMLIFEDQVEHTLHDPTFVTSYPIEVSPLSRRNDADPWLADRFELMVGGREIANGFSELNDPEDQAARFREQAARKAGGDHEAMFYDEDYVRALEHGMPPTAGEGIGIDRLTMLLTDSSSIRDVILFPLLKPE
jgi:lysyl-tRNA synthetase class 2